MTLKEQIIAAMSVPGVNINDVADPDLYAKAKEIEAFVTGGVDFLRSKFPNGRVNRLMSLVWDLIGNKLTPVGIGPDVPTLSMTVTGRKGDPKSLQAVILTPHRWRDMIASDHIFQMGALVFCGSQAADFYNNRLIGEQQQAIQRAGAYESEYLHTIQSVTSDWKPNLYQARMMKEYPAGVETPAIKGLMYQSRPFSMLPFAMGNEAEHWAQIHRRQ